MQFELNLDEKGSTPSQLQTLTRELSSALGRQKEISASLPEGSPEPGKRGDPQTIGAIVLQLAASGGVIVSLLNVLKTYFERRPSLEVEVRRADGAQLKINAHSVGLAQVDGLSSQLTDFLKAG